MDVLPVPNGTVSWYQGCISSPTLTKMSSDPGTASFTAAGISGMAVAPGSHLAGVTDEFGGPAFGVVRLPATGGAGALRRALLLARAFARIVAELFLAFDYTVYFFDEPSSYLDIYQRLQVAKVIQGLAKEKYVVVVEHDLAVLDFLADTGQISSKPSAKEGVLWTSAFTGK